MYKINNDEKHLMKEGDVAMGYDDRGKVIVETKKDRLLNDAKQGKIKGYIKFD